MQCGRFLWLCWIGYIKVVGIVDWALGMNHQFKYQLYSKLAYFLPSYLQYTLFHRRATPLAFKLWIFPVCMEYSFIDSTFVYFFFINYNSTKYLQQIALDTREMITVKWKKKDFWTHTHRHTYPYFIFQHLKQMQKSSRPTQMDWIEKHEGKEFVTYKIWRLIELIWTQMVFSSFVTKMAQKDV